MKKFFSENWYRLMVGSSLLMASFGFMIRSLAPANAEGLPGSTSNYNIIPVNSDGSISVRLSGEQLNKLALKNQEGSVDIKLSDKQLKALSPNPVQAVNIQEVYGGEAAAYFAYKDNAGNAHYSLGVDRSPW